jgi:RND family efflux transporter MFP subunit
MKRRNLIFAAAGLVLLVIVGLIAARPRNTAIEVRTDTAAIANFETKLPETGTLQRPVTQTITALVGGNLGRLYVKSGDRVAAGQLLAKIENPQIVATLTANTAAALSASSRARSAEATNVALPSQLRSNVVQAQATLVQARVQLQQARQDLAAGSQSGLGYGGSTAEEQRLAADANASKADTDLREAQRIYDANRELYAQKAISKDALDQASARLDQARVAANQAHREREILTGTLARNKTVLGDRVRAAENAVRQSEAALEAAEAGSRNTKEADVQAARADAARAETDRAYAADQVERLTIRAPFAGLVEAISSQPGDTLRPLQPGDTIQPGQEIMKIAADNGFIVRAKVDEQDISGVRAGQKVRIGGEDFGQATLPGHVASVSAIAQRSDDPSNTARQIVTTIALDGTLPFLRDGMSVDVDIITKSRPNVLVVSSDAIRKDGANAYVFAVVNGKARKTAVTLGDANDVQTVIASGLAAGDVVVADKSAAIVDGAAVKPAPKPSASAAPASTG